MKTPPPQHYFSPGLRNIGFLGQKPMASQLHSQIAAQPSTGLTVM